MAIFFFIFAVSWFITLFTTDRFWFFTHYTIFAWFKKFYFLVILLEKLIISIRKICLRLIRPCSRVINTDENKWRGVKLYNFLFVSPEFFKSTKVSKNGCNHNIISLQKWDGSKNRFGFTYIHLFSLLKKSRGEPKISWYFFWFVLCRSKI